MFEYGGVVFGIVVCVYYIFGFVIDEYFGFVVIVGGDDELFVVEYYVIVGVYVGVDVGGGVVEFDFIGLDVLF